MIPMANVLILNENDYQDNVNGFVYSANHPSPIRLSNKHAENVNPRSLSLIENPRLISSVEISPSDSPVPMPLMIRREEPFKVNVWIYLPFILSDFIYVYKDNYCLSNGEQQTFNLFIYLIVSPIIEIVIIANRLCRHDPRVYAIEHVDNNHFCKGKFEKLIMIVHGFWTIIGNVLFWEYYAIKCPRGIYTYLSCSLIIKLFINLIELFSLWLLLLLSLY